MSDDSIPDDVDVFFNQLERAASVDAAINSRIAENHLSQSERVIANVAALKAINSDDLIQSVLGNPT